MSYHVWLRDGRTLVCMNCGHMLAREIVNAHEVYFGDCENPDGIHGSPAIENGMIIFKITDEVKRERLILGKIERRLAPALELSGKKSFSAFTETVNESLTERDKAWLKSLERKRGSEPIVAWLFQVAQDSGFAVGGTVGFKEV